MGQSSCSPGRSRETRESALTLTCQEKMHRVFHPNVNLWEGMREEEMSYALGS